MTHLLYGLDITVLWAMVRTWVTYTVYFMVYILLWAMVRSGVTHLHYFKQWAGVTYLLYSLTLLWVEQWEEQEWPISSS